MEKSFITSGPDFPSDFEQLSDTTKCAIETEHGAF